MNILVTGGLQGIGKGIVKALQTRGDKTFIFDYVGENDSRVEI